MARMVILDKDGSRWIGTRLSRQSRCIKSHGCSPIWDSMRELPEIVNLWRNASPRIRDLWYAVENAAVYTVTTGESYRPWPWHYVPVRNWSDIWISIYDDWRYLADVSCLSSASIKQNAFGRCTLHLRLRQTLHGWLKALMEQISRKHHTSSRSRLLRINITPIGGL